MDLEVRDFTREQQEELLQRYAKLTFANLKRNIVQDLINEKNESVIYKKYRKEDIVRMLENPQKHEKQIRELSGFIYLVSSHYRRLIDYYATILLYNYTIVPIKISVNKMNKSQYKKDYIRIVNLCEKYNLKHEAQKSIKIAIRDGVFFGICYESEDSFYIKNVNPNLCRITSIEDGTFRFSFDMAYFSGKEELLEMYGQDFITAYYAYKGNREKGIKGDKKKKWYEVPNGICVKADPSDPLYSIVPMAGLLLDILSIDDYKLLKKAKVEADNYKILSMKLETNDEGFPLIPYDLSSRYFSTACDALPTGVGAILTPFNITDHSFKTSNTADSDNVSEAVKTYWESAGISNALFGGGNVTSSGGMTLSVKPDEAFVFTMLQQFEGFFNTKFKKINLKNTFKLKFSQQSIFNQDEYANRLSKAAQYGTPTKLLYMSSLGMTPSDVLGMTYLENDVLNLSGNTWDKPLISSNTQSSSESRETGRPKSEDNGEIIGDAGEKSREQN